MSAQANDKLRDRLIGSWKLVSAMREEISSGEKTPFLGENPTGFLHYMPDGRMLALITRAGRKPPAGNVATPAEAEGLIRSMIAYGSRYECVGDEVLHHCCDGVRRALVSMTASGSAHRPTPCHRS